MIQVKLVNSFITRFVVVGILIVSITISITIYNYDRSISNFVPVHTKTVVDNINLLLNGALAPLIFVEDLAATEDFLTQLVKSDKPLLKFVTVYNRKNEVFFGFGKSSDISSQSFSQSDEDKTVEMIELNLAGLPVGRAYYEISLHGINQFAENTKTQSTVIGVMGVIFIALFLTGLGFRFYRRVDKLMLGSSALSGGDYTAKINISGNDEISQLAQHLNSMADAISSRNIALTESEETHRLAMQATTDGLWDWEIKSGEVYYSPSWATILGEKEVSLEYETWEKRIHPDDKTKILSTLQHHLENRSDHWSQEHRLKTKNGQWKWVLGRGQVVARSENGEPLRMVGTMTDISKRKQTEEELSFQALLLNQIQDHVTATDLEGNILYVNEAELKTTKRGLDELLGKSVDIFGEDATKGATQKQIIENTLKYGKWRGEVVNYDVEGGEIIMDCRTSLIQDENGKPWRLLGISTDITEQKAKEIELKKIRKILNEAQELGKVSGWEVDVRSWKAFWSPNQYKMLGYQPGEIQNLHRFFIEKIVHPDDKDRLSKVFKQLMNGENRISIEFRAICKDGRERVLHGIVTNELDDDGNVVRVYGSNLDITEQKESEKLKADLERQILQGQKMESIGNLAGGIAHDFNNLLFPIIGMAELLLEDLPQGSPEHDNAREILIAGLRGSDLVKQILAFGRRAEHKLMPTRIQKILIEVLKLSRASIPTNIEIEENIEQECGMVMADQTQLHQVAMNLITNAYHAVEADSGKITVALKAKTISGSQWHLEKLKPGNYAVLSVIDNGIGIEPMMLEQIFEPYFTTKEQGKGTGLGLSVVHGIIKDYGGEIIVSSVLGKGSRFDVYIPLLSERTTPEETSVIVDLPAGEESILVVDDESSVIKLESQMLQKLGYKVKPISDSTQALEIFNKSPESFDLVITDMSMPILTGDKLSKRLKQIRPDIPIIMCTGFNDRINEQKARKIGIKGFLMKPIAMAELAYTVRKILDETDNITQ